MPEYSYQCEKCDHGFSKIWSISEYEQRSKKNKCPECKSTQVYRNYQADNVVGNYIKGLHECKTLGEYADKQTAKLSNDERNTRLAGFKTKKTGGMKELPTGMSRTKNPGQMPSPITKTQAKTKRNKKK